MAQAKTNKTRNRYAGRSSEQMSGRENRYRRGAS
jgi:hypothetical protein